MPGNDITPGYAGPTIGKPRPRGLDDDITFASISGMSARTYGENGPFRQTVFTFTNMALTLTNTSGSTGYSSLLIGTFPKGKIHVIGAVSRLTFTTTSVLASTLNASTSTQYGFGSAAASATTLATTMINFLAGTGQTVPTFTSSATINVAASAVTHHTLANPIPIDGSVTALPIYFNLAAAAGLTATATLTVTGTLVINWSNLGGDDFANS